MRNDQGQIILALILVMSVALAIGLSIVQKSLIDVSTSTKVEESSRAFSAAEAGIEKSLQSGSCGTNCVNFDNNSKADVYDSGPLPPITPAGTTQPALEYQLLAKEDTAQVWLADYTSSRDPPDLFYDPPSSRSLDILWGNSSQDKAALELTLVYYDGAQYSTRQWFLDNSSASRNPANNFDQVPCSANHTIGTTIYQCYIRLGDGSINPAKNGPLPDNLMLIRARLLYNNTSQPLAVQAVGTCGQACSLPPQARIVDSKGSSGETQRVIRLFRMNNVVPSYFDYAIFSAGDIRK